MSNALRDVLGIALSYLFVFGFIGLATLLMRRHVLPGRATRKVIHIGVSHWWLIAMFVFDDPWVASVGPVSFILINAAALRFKLLPAMDEGGETWGTVYFPVALLVLVNLCWRSVLPLWVGGAATLILGWGDGLASLVGERSKGAKLLGGSKTLAGSAVMFAASFVVALTFTLIFDRRFGSIGPALGVAAVVAAAAAIVEGATPLGLDNLTVPATVAALYGLVFA